MGEIPGASTLGIDSPDRVQYAIQSLLPGLGEIGVGAVEKLVPDDRPKPERGVAESLARDPMLGPFFRSFTGPMPSASRRDLNEVLYQTGAKASQARTSLNYLDRLGDPKKLEQFLAQRPEAELLASANPDLTRLQREAAELNFLRQQAQMGALGIEGAELTALLADITRQEALLRQEAAALADALK